MVIRYTVKELKKIAKFRGVKINVNGNVEYLRNILGMEPLDYPSRYDHCRKKKVAQAIIVTNVETGEEVEYKSIFEASKVLGVFAGTITYRLKTMKTLL